MIPTEIKNQITWIGIILIIYFIEVLIFDSFSLWSNVFMDYVKNLILCMIFIYPPFSLYTCSFIHYIMTIVLHLTALPTFFPFHIISISPLEVFVSLFLQYWSKTDFMWLFWHWSTEKHPWMLKWKQISPMWSILIANIKYNTFVCITIHLFQVSIW